MWVFGYGSLMWDDWEKSRGSVARVMACVSGYRRCFNKASVKNWGTKEHPGPTLNLERAENECCRGFAFEFPDDRRTAILEYLAKREGGFALESLSISLPDGAEVNSIVPIYRGKNLIVGRSTGEIAEMVMRAKGTEGPCATYVSNIAKMLTQLGIEDLAVSTLSNALT